MSSPAGVPGPTLVSRSFSSAVSIRLFARGPKAAHGELVEPSVLRQAQDERRGMKHSAPPLNRRGLAGASFLLGDLELVCRHSDDGVLVAEGAGRITAILDRVDRVQVHAAQRLDAEVTVGQQVLVL